MENRALIKRCLAPSMRASDHARREWRRRYKKIVSSGDKGPRSGIGPVVWMPPMTSSGSEKSDEVLRSALAGVPRVATVIAYMPPQERERALVAAKQSYERTAQELGFTRAAARQWASTVLRRLKEEVAELQGTGSRETGNELSFPKIISARTDDEPGPDGSKKEAS